MHRRPRPHLLAAVLAVAATAGCSWTGGDSEPLREGAESLLPPGAQVTERVESDCIELARSPSCFFLYLDPGDRPTEQRARRFREAARTSGWRERDVSLLPGGGRIDVERDDLLATIFVPGARVLEACRERDLPPRDCSDIVSVRRD